MNQNKNVNTGKRIVFLDNLRTFMIFLVVSLHCALVYESTGGAGLFWIVYDYSNVDLFVVMNIILDIFVMSTIFFIAGFLTPRSLEKRRPLAFVKSKTKRLLIPWLIAVLTLMPLYKMIYLYSRGLPQQHWTTYFHWNNGIFSQNWLWFLPVLFLFNVLYVLLSRLKIDWSRLSLKIAVPVGFVLSVMNSFLLKILNGQGWTKTALIDFQNERLLIYFVVFLAGTLCFERNVFSKPPGSRKPTYMVLGIFWIPIVLYRFFYVQTMHPGQVVFSEIVDAFVLSFSFCLSLLCLLFVLINGFRYFLDKQGKVLTELNRNSYGVYIIHTIVLGGIALTMVDTGIPAILKFGILTLSTYVLSNLLVSLHRAIIKRK